MPARLKNQAAAAPGGPLPMTTTVRSLSTARVIYHEETDAIDVCGSAAWFKGRPP
jgi:hypothetical protein